MAWIRVESSVARNPKFLSAGPAAAWLWLCGLAYAQDGLTDGFIPTQALPILGAGRKSAALSRRLVDARLWDVSDGGWMIHDYLQHNRPASEIRRIRAIRSESGALGGAASWQQRANQSASTELLQHAKGRAEPICTYSTAVPTAVHTHRPHARATTLVVPPIQYRNISHFSPLGDVPRFVHDELVRKVQNGGATETDADRQVRAFYTETERGWSGQIVGDEPPKFWRAQFAARVAQGTARGAPTATDAVRDALDDDPTMAPGGRRRPV